jgi:hypothetical protein
MGEDDESPGPPPPSYAGAPADRRDPATRLKKTKKKQKKGFKIKMRFKL